MNWHTADGEANLNALVLMKSYCEAQQKTLSRYKKAVVALGSCLHESEKAAKALLSTTNKSWSQAPTSEIFVALHETTKEMTRASDSLLPSLAASKKKLEFAVQDMGCKFQQLTDGEGDQRA